MNTTLDLVQELEARLQQLDPTRTGEGNLPLREAVTHQSALTGQAGLSARLSPGAVLVAQMHEAFLQYIYGPEAAPGPETYLQADLVALESTWKDRRHLVQPRGFLWGEWGEKLMRILTLFFPGLQVKQNIMGVARQLEDIERQALLSMHEARQRHYHREFEVWQKLQQAQQEIVLAKGVIFQVMNDLQVLVNAFTLSEEGREQLGKLLLEQLVLPRILQALAVSEEEQSSQQPETVRGHRPAQEVT